MSDPRRILFVRPDSIGDNILAASMLPHLKERYPRAEITVLCQPHIAELYEYSPVVDRTITVDKGELYANEPAVQQMVATLQSRRFDLTLHSVFSREPIGDALAVSSGAAETIAFFGDTNNSSVESLRFFNERYTRLVDNDPDEWKAEIDRHWEFLAAIGILPPPLEPVVWTSTRDEAFADEIFESKGLESERTIAVSPGAQFDHRVWPQYGDVVREFGDFSLVALGTTAEVGLAELVCRAFPGKSVNLAGRTNLRQMASVIRRCRLLLGAESAAVHMACAVGVPNVTLLGGGHFGRFMPYSPLTTAVCLPLDCYRCCWRCRHPRTHCVADILPAPVVAAVAMALDGPSPAQPRVVVQSDGPIAVDGQRPPEWTDPADKLCRASDVVIVEPGETEKAASAGA